MLPEEPPLACQLIMLINELYQTVPGHVEITIQNDDDVVIDFNDAPAGVVVHEDDGER